MGLDDILKGNFKVKNPPKIDDTKTNDTEGHTKIAEDLRAQALRALGGSMVYVDRKTMTWNGDE
jgi:hypothetical protein